MYKKKTNFKKKTTRPNKKVSIKSEDSSEDDMEVREGRVIEALPAALFRVRFENNEELICFLRGKIKVFKIKILVGDKVLVEIDPYGGKGRIIRRV